MTLVRRRGAIAGARAAVAGGPVTGDIAATLPALTQAATGTAEQVTGDIAATLPALTQAATGTVGGAVIADIAATLPALTQAASGSVEVRGDIGSNLPGLSQAATGTVEAGAEHIGTTSAGPTNANTLAVDVPSGVQEDDDLLLISATPVEADTATAPAGWTLLANLNAGSTYPNRVKVWHRVAGASEPADHTIDQTGKAGSTYHAAQMVALRGGTLGELTVGTLTTVSDTPIRARQTTYLHYAGLSLVYCGWRTDSDGDTVTAPAELTQLSQVNTRPAGTVPFMWLGYEGDLDLGDADRDFTAGASRRGRVGLQISYYDGDALTDVTARPTIEVNEAWDFDSPALPTGWQDGDLHLLIAAQQATDDIVAAGYARIGFGIDFVRTQVMARYLETGDTAPTVTGGAELMARSLLVRNGRILLDDPAAALFESGAEAGTFAAQTFTGEAICLIAGSTYFEDDPPTLTTDDTYTSSWLQESGFTDLRGYLADVTDGADDVSWTWGSSSVLTRVILRGAQ